jgi:hypothetical protein
MYPFATSTSEQALELVKTAGGVEVELARSRNR